MKKLKKNKSLYWFLGISIFVIWVAFRIFMLSSEANRIVFNQVRYHKEYGVPVNTVVVNNKSDFLSEPLLVQNNRAYVSAVRINKFKAGQTVGAGKITSVSKSIDINTGMYLISTSGVKNGENFVQIKHTGFFVPQDAIIAGNVFIVKDGLSFKQKVKISAQDSDSAVVSGGLSENDIVIISGIEEGRKIR